MLQQQLPTNHIITGAARAISEFRQLPDEQAQAALMVAYDTLHAIGLPENGLFMLFGSMSAQLDPPCPFPEHAQLKCQICEEEARNLVRTSGGNQFVVCSQCASGLVAHGAHVEL